MALTVFQKRALKRADAAQGWAPTNAMAKKRAFSLVMLGLMVAVGDGRYVLTDAGRAARGEVSP